MKIKMTRKFEVLAGAVLALALQFNHAVAQDARSPLESAGPDAAEPLVIVATPTSSVLVFHAAAVGVSEASAQKLVATFDVSGYTGTFTPTAAFHYGHDYTHGPVTCVVSGSTETCKVTISFLPTLPGARKDALLLLDGSTTLATVLLGGTGQAPLSLIQPGVVTSPVLNADYYIYQSVVDENGTVYYLSDNSNAVYSITKAGVVTQLPITSLNSPHAIAIDGAGTLYIAQNTYATDIVTYTSAGVQGSIAVIPPSPPYSPCSSFEYLYSVAFDQSGNLFVLDIECQQIFELKANGTYVTNAIDPAMTQPSEISVDANDNVFIGGYAINKLAASGIQTQVNTVGASEGVPVDAADTLYATRYTGFGGVVELPASGYSTPFSTPTANLDPAASPLGDSVGSDGTVYVGNSRSRQGRPFAGCDCLRRAVCRRHQLRRGSRRLQRRQQTSHRRLNRPHRLRLCVEGRFHSQLHRGHRDRPWRLLPGRIHHDSASRRHLLGDHYLHLELPEHKQHHADGRALGICLRRLRRTHAHLTHLPRDHRRHHQRHKKCEDHQ